VSKTTIFDKDEALVFSAEVSKEVATAIKEALEAKGQSYADALLDIPLKKAEGHTLQRATIFSAALESHGIDWRAHVRVAASIELLVASMYLHNRIFDNKGGIDFSKNPTIGRHAIAGNLCRELACGMMSSETDSRKERILRWSSEIFDYGQYLAYESAKGFDLPVHRCDSAMIMLRRAYCINAAYYQGIGALAAAVAGAGVAETSRLTKWCVAYGMLVQFVNDIADFTPPSFNEATVEKVPTDAFSDYRKRELSLVLHKLIHSGGNLSSEEACLQSAGRLGALASSMQLCHDIARCLGGEAATKGLGLMGNMAFLGISNRYFKDIWSMKRRKEIEWGAVTDALENQLISGIVMHTQERLWETLPAHLKPKF
jgi:geranylgeranyl pyrophosphate synthase